MALCETASVAVGIDIGGQSSKIGIVDREGHILGRSVLPADGDTNPDDFIAKLAEAVRALISSCAPDSPIAGVGVGAPNANFYTGCISHAPNLPWANGKTVPFAQMLSWKLDDVPVTITNDANAAAMGEMKYGVAKDLKHFIEITLGTGVGSGVVVDGKILYGSDGFAGELGHSCVEMDGRQCGCGNRGCLEAYASATGVARTAREWLDSSDEPSSLRQLTKITSKDVAEAAAAGDALALRVFDYTGTILGTKLADFVHFSAPQAIVLFGGLARAGELIYAPTIKAMNARLLPIWKDKVKLLFSSLPESDAAILGASALVWA